MTRGLQLKMRFVKAIFLCVFVFAGVCTAQDDTARFRYRAGGAIPVGTVLHYLKTNIDGTRPEHVSQFIAAEDSLESFKFHPKSPPAGLVVARMDWRSFSARTLTSWRVHGKGERKLFGTISFDASTRRAEVSLPTVRSEPETFAFARLPVHLYNFDFASLNFALPHLADPKATFRIGVADPTFRPDGALAEYKGEATVTYLSDEKRAGVAVRKYRIDGAGLQNRGGHIWVNKRRGWIEDMEIDLPDNPEWASFKLKLVRAEKMTRARWDAFIESQL